MVKEKEEEEEDEDKVNHKKGERRKLWSIKKKKKIREIIKVTLFSKKKDKVKINLNK